jgi:RNase P subunit RPR2
MSRLISAIDSFFCSHNEYMLVKYRQAGAQSIRLRPSCQYWRCSKCGANIGPLGIASVE